MHLAKIFKSVIAVDISQNHLDICADELKRVGVENVRLLHLSSLDDIQELPAFNCFVSFIVLQHNPPPVMAHILNAVLAKLERNGVALFQVPTYRQGYRFDLKDYLDNPGPLTMEMHVLPQAKVFEIISENHCQPLHIREDGWADGRTQECISNTFFLRKP
jgi:cyclopropane fatty-acyl-phospholipid synthase-like methyltransferase